MPAAPKILPIEDAIREIRSGVSAVNKKGGAKPFAFLVGAGISAPSIPLAGAIETECRTLAERDGVRPPPGNPSSMERYSYWFGKAHPHPVQRRDYLKSLIEGKPISLANFRLAHLLAANCVANLVITPNFDNLLARALVTFGCDAVRICDHPNTVERISATNTDVQIVHVHGNHWSYDQANLSGELERRSEPSSTSTSSMAQLLDALFREVSPIVVGYSGWEQDVIMRALDRRLKSPLGYKIYWFCYRRENLDSLPGWLTGHAEVVFVAPPDTRIVEKTTPAAPDATAPEAGPSAASPSPNLRPVSLGRRLTGPTSSKPIRFLTVLAGSLGRKLPCCFATHLSSWLAVSKERFLRMSGILEVRQRIPLGP